MNWSALRRCADPDALIGLSLQPEVLDELCCKSLAIARAMATWNSAATLRVAEALKEPCPRRPSIPRCAASTKKNRTASAAISRPTARVARALRTAPSSSTSCCFTCGSSNRRCTPIAGFALVALGGFGRRALYPQSDIDLLFLCENEALRSRAKDPVRSICQELWDTGLRVSPTTRTIDDCGRFDQDNVEFTISLLDCRFLIGDEKLFARLRDKSHAAVGGARVGHSHPAPHRSNQHPARQVWQDHLSSRAEPEGRSGRTARFSRHPLDRPDQRRWRPIANGPNRCTFSRTPMTTTCSRRWSFFRRRAAICTTAAIATRTSSPGRPRTTWRAAVSAAGTGPLSSAEWMRLYFRNAKAIYRNATQLLEQTSANRSTLVRSFRRWRSRASNDEFSVVDRRVYIQQSAGARDPEVVLRLFVFMARHGVKLAMETERRLNNARRAPARHHAAGCPAVDASARVAGAAERCRSAARHAFPPSAGAGDCLSSRPSTRWCCATSTTATRSMSTRSWRLMSLHRLRDNERRVAAAVRGAVLRVGAPGACCFWRCCFTTPARDWRATTTFTEACSLRLPAVERLGLSNEDAQTVGFLIASHLEMSSTLRRRDIYDPETIRELAAKMETPERLKMLTLMTLADIKAVNPEALTPWKAENLWQLYIATANYFTRSVDEQRFHAEVCTEQVERIAALLPKGRSQLLKFLDGLPQRYLMSHSPEQVIAHFEMANRLRNEPVQLGLRRARDQHELTVVTEDRPGLFSTLTGILYGWGMDITKASAFSNRGGSDRRQLLFQGPLPHARTQSIRTRALQEVGHRHPRRRLAARSPAGAAPARRHQAAQAEDRNPPAL